MKHLSLLTSLGLVALMFCTPRQTKNVLPQPTDKTAIHTQGESEGNGDARAAWIELIHGGKTANWRSIEAKNQWEQYEKYVGQTLQTRGGDEWVADNNILGRWVERGSNNNAGNIEIADFDAVTEQFYVIGGGGCMFRGDFSGYAWQPLNEKLRFSTHLIKVINTPSGERRIIAGINGIPHISTDEGVTWTPSTGVSATSDGWYIYDAEYTEDNTIFFLGKKSYAGPVRLYVSRDYGSTYTAIKTFNTSDDSDYRLAYDGAEDKVYALERTNNTSCSVYVYNKNNNLLDPLGKNKPLVFGGNYRANMVATTYKDTVRLYAFNQDKEVFLSKDKGESWSKFSNLPTDPWSVDLYISPSDPRKIFYGEVDSYRSFNNGKNWSKMSSWGDYYSDYTRKLHADIMYMKEFKTLDNKVFQVNCNHGGIYISYDYGTTWENIGLFGLNVGQFYDVKTYPHRPDYMFAGTQDQGMQRGLALWDAEETSSMFQHISGDYGHLTFTNNGKSMWTVYPDGSISYYADPLIQNYPIAGYEIKSKTETVWIPPIMAGPDPTKDIVYAAGGSTNEDANGSHLIKLEYDKAAGNITATQLSTNFSAGGNGTIASMAIDPFDKDKWYVATTTGSFFRSNNGAQTFSKTEAFLSESNYLYGSWIMPSKVTPNTVYICGNGYTYKPVYKSINSGDTWVDMSKGLPRTTVFKIAANEDESLIYAATEAGPYVYIAAKGQWYNLSGTGTPVQTYWSVEYIPEHKAARFGTYGRGAWDFYFRDIAVSTEQEYTIDLKITPNPTTDNIEVQGLEGFISYTWYVYDSRGAIVRTTHTIGTHVIDLSGLPRGIYMLRSPSLPLRSSKIVKI
jgi:hypothetical protein